MPELPDPQPQPSRLWIFIMAPAALAATLVMLCALALAAVLVPLKNYLGRAWERWPAWCKVRARRWDRQSKTAMEWWWTVTLGRWL